jgi:hypothetical protein
MLDMGPKRPNENEECMQYLPSQLIQLSDH